MSRKTYPSDITREQFEAIRTKLDDFRHTTKPRSHDLYDIFCGILYVLKTGCQWRALPSDYPPWRSVYSYYRQWGAKPFEDKPSLLEQLLQERVEHERSTQGRLKKQP